MVTGTLRMALWVLGGIAVLWLHFGLTMLPAMGSMMNGEMTQGGMMNGGMMGEGMMGNGMMRMMGLMAAQFIAMLGLVGIFIYLVVDSIRNRSPRREKTG